MNSSIENTNPPTIKDSLQNNIKLSERKPALFQTDDGREIVNQIFNYHQQLEKIEGYIHYTSKVADFAKKIKGTFRKILKSLFLKKSTSWIDEVN